MLMYKVMRYKSDGMLYSVNVARRKLYSIDEWYEAECILTKHYIEERGFHGYEKPDIPKYKQELQRGEKRIWVECEVSDCETKYNAHDKTTWVIAQRMKILRALSEDDIREILES